MIYFGEPIVSIWVGQRSKWGTRRLLDKGSYLVRLGRLGITIRTRHA